MKTLGSMTVALAAALTVLVVQEVESHNPITTTVRFNREVAAVLNARCVHCHVDGGLAMPFQTYAEVRPWAVAIKEEVLARHMPPWPAEPGFGTFANDGGLTPREREFLVSWVDGGVPEGEGRPPAYHDHSGHWMLGEPHAVFVAAPDANGSPAGMTRFVVSTGFREARSIAAIDMVMPDRRTARAAFVSLLDTGEYLGGWTPWHSAIELPGDVAFRFPAGARLAVDVLGGARPSEMTPPRLALYMADGERHAIQRGMTLAAEAETGVDHVRARESIETTLTVVGFRVDMSPGGRSIELTARRPDGAFEPLLWIKEYRHDWQVPFVLREPVTLPAGSVLQASAYFDRSHSTGNRVAVFLTGYEGPQLPAGPTRSQAVDHLH
jgi:hypothetical protein